MDRHAIQFILHLISCFCGVWKQDEWRILPVSSDDHSALHIAAALVVGVGEVQHWRARGDRPVDHRHRLVADPHVLPQDVAGIVGLGHEVVPRVVERPRRPGRAHGQRLALAEGACAINPNIDGWTPERLKTLDGSVLGSTAGVAGGWITPVDDGPGSLSTGVSATVSGALGCGDRNSPNGSGVVYLPVVES